MNQFFHDFRNHDARCIFNSIDHEWWPVVVLSSDRSTENPDLTAVPAGLQAGRMFIWLFSIMLPVYLSTNDAELAFKVGVLAHLIGGIVFIIGAFVVPILLKIVPAGALFGSLAGGAMAFLILQPMNGTLNMPVVGWLSMIVLFIIYIGHVEVKLPAALIAIVIGSAIAWISGAMGFDAVTESLTNLNLYIPHPVLGIFDGSVLSAVIPFLPIVIVFSINEVITGIQAVEQAKECGDTYFTTTKPLVICGIASIIGACFGNPLAVGLYRLEKDGIRYWLSYGYCSIICNRWFNRSGCNFKCIYSRGGSTSDFSIYRNLKLLSGI